ncbi:hypothetical protein OH76DRAFT_649622 [Lentinus brumalis]|uniref:Uncharacterized protein n=1 Tax=Lentinus brumalis TaxID=2498619 RepID=A0A371D820_9APHY|nr:hypothetical protein OH76DRAFT_649622 [Polyporus brumalis]
MEIHHSCCGRCPSIANVTLTSRDSFLMGCSCPSSQISNSIVMVTDVFVDGVIGVVVILSENDVVCVCGRRVSASETSGGRRPSNVRCPWAYPCPWLDSFRTKAKTRAEKGCSRVVVTVGRRKVLGVISAAASSAFTTTTTTRIPILTSKCTPASPQRFLYPKFIFFCYLCSLGLGILSVPSSVLSSSPASSSSTIERL